MPAPPGGPVMPGVDTTTPATRADLGNLPVGVPFDGRRVSNEVGAGYLVAYAAQSELMLDPDGDGINERSRYSQNAAKTNFAQLKVWSVDDTTFIIENAIGGKLVFSEDVSKRAAKAPLVDGYEYNQLGTQQNAVLGLSRASGGGGVRPI